MTGVPRRQRLAELLGKAEVDVLLVTREVNVRWLTGFTGDGTCLVRADGGCVLVTDGRYAEQAAAQAPDVELVTDRTRGWLPARLGLGERLGVESHELSWDEARALAEELGQARVVPAPGQVEALRQVKDEPELALIRQACAVTSAAFAALLGWLAPGMTEIEAARRLRDEIEGLGGDSLAFDTIMAAGPHSARPHHRPTGRRLARGDLVKIDFGAMVGGYCSDMTRVVALGPVDPQLRRVYGIVREAQAAGVAAVGDGVSASAVDAACRDPITAAGYGEQFVHGTGHGLGLEIHEQPILRAKATATLTTHMTVTVEPGIYLPGIGGVRIEDTVAVLPSGPEPLTTATHELVTL
ncbi:MAG: M24 family metallopeptidase [Egibacteraceae bacterium]